MITDLPRRKWSYKKDVFVYTFEYLLKISTPMYIDIIQKELSKNICIEKIKIHDNEDKIQHDYVVKKIDGELNILANKNTEYNIIPLKEYVDIVDNNKNEDKQKDKSMSFLKQELESANWFSVVIKKRAKMIYDVVDAVVKFQRDFFLSGDANDIRLMGIDDISNMLDIDRSQVSRIMSDKYIKTDFGIFSLKYFFHGGIKLQNEVGANKKIVNEIKKIFDGGTDMLRDVDVKNLLKEKGYEVPRRTITKYRNILKIPNFYKRKRGC